MIGASYRTPLARIFHNSVHYYEETQKNILVYRWTGITNAQRHLLLLVNIVFLSELVSLIGIFGNIVNMIVFYQQGLNTTTNISLFFIAFSDLSCLLIQQWSVVLSFLNNSKLPINSVDFQYLTAGVPHEIFARLTCSVTVYITAERCLCIVVPLKIKRIFTITRTKVAILLIYVLTLALAAPCHTTIYVGWKFNSERNRTILGLVVTDNKDMVEKVTLTANAVSGVVSVTAVVIFTSISIYKLKEKSAWRKSANVQLEKSDPLSKRDRTTIAMVVVIACILVVCYTPSVILCVITCVEPDFNVGRRLAYEHEVSWMFATLLENINSSVNVFLYLKLSSNYRRTFQSLFFRHPQSDNVFVTDTAMQQFR